MRSNLPFKNALSWLRAFKSPYNNACRVITNTLLKILVLQNFSTEPLAIHPFEIFGSFKISRENKLRFKIGLVNFEIALISRYQKSLMLAE